MPGIIAKGAKASSGVSTIANAVTLAKELKPTLKMLQSFKREASYAFSNIRHLHQLIRSLNLKESEEDL